MVFTVLWVLALAGTLAASAYSALVLCAGVYYRRQSTRWQGGFSKAFDSPVSVLKPVHGETLDLRENLSSFYQQSYRDYEVVFGARSKLDPALTVARMYADQYPGVRTTVLATGEPRWPNARAFSVSELVKAADHNILVITDSDVRIPKDFLSEVVKPLEDPAVGLVTCPYRGISSGGFWTDLEALGMSVELMSNVLAANMLNGMDFALGPATASRRDALAAIGGLEATGEYYADDFALGSLISRAGLKVVLSPVVVEHIVPHSSFKESFQHQVLWLKNNRFLRMREHLGIVLTFAMPFAMLGFLIEFYRTHVATAILWLLYGVLQCLIRSVAIGWKIVGDHQALRKCWLYPVRDFLGFATWLATWFGDEVVFRGQRYKLLRGGKVRRL